MSQDKNLGVVSASVRIEKNGLRTDVADIKNLMKQMADNMETATERAERRATAAVQAQAARRAAILKQYASQAGKTMTVLGTAIEAGLAAATKKAADFDQAMRNVNSIAKLNEKQFRDLSQSIKKLTDDPNIRQAPEDLAKGLYDVYSSGFEGQKALDILRVSAVGASAGMTDTATSSRVLMAVLNSGVKGVESTGQAMDVLFQEVNLGVNSFEQLSGAIGDVLPTAKTAGVSLQEIGASLAVMTRQGINVNEATTALNNLLIHLIKPGKEAAGLMDKLGIEYGLNALQAKGLTGALQEIMEKTHGNKQAMTLLMPEIRGLKALLALTGDGGKQYSEMLAGMTDKTQVQNATQKAATEQMKGAKAQFEKLTQQVTNLAMEIGDHLLPKGIQLMQWVNRQIQAFRNLSDGTKGTITQIALFSGALLIAGGTVIKLISAIAELKSALVTLGVIGAGTGARVAAGLATALGAMGRFASSAAGVGIATVGFLTASKSTGDGTLHAPQNPKDALQFWQSRLKATRGYLGNKNAPGYDPNIDYQKTEAFQAQKVREIQGQMQAAALSKKAQEDAARMQKQSEALMKGGGGSAGVDKILAGLKGKKGRGGGSGGRRSGATAAERAMEDAARDAQAKARDQEQLNDEILAATPGVTEFQVERRRIGRRYQENVRNGMPQQKALDLWTAENAKVDEAQRQAALDAAKTRNEQRDEAGKAKFEANIDRGMTGLSSQMETEAWQKQNGMNILGKFLNQYVFDVGNQRAADEQEAEKDRAREEEAQKEQQHLDRRKEWEAQYNLLSLAQYKAYLQQRLGSMTEYSDEWMTVQGKIYDIERQQQDEQDRRDQERKKKWKTLADGFQGVFASAFENVLSSGKDFFQSLLDGFKQMLIKMVAEALAAKIVGSLFGGLVGGGGGLLGLFGFDDAHNDGIARRWGWDAARNFAVGAQDYGRQRGVALAGAGSGGDTPIQIHMHGDMTINSGHDIEEIGKELAWHVQQRRPVVRR